ncbi:hypothetical protein RU97_GL000063 [Enterococcus canis]|uniref:Uncharacterized protein n=1 Tax=Enterococcus canis TaxID=214095 RepID=A0A1L8RJ84_9ENTE|nr:hypothetical protein [Enterococcus canis]OJG19830.1 hypothetical protein RU97_GL000063 [Enterococcus canis]
MTAKKCYGAAGLFLLSGILFEGLRWPFVAIACLLASYGFSLPEK